MPTPLWPHRLRAALSQAAHYLIGRYAPTGERVCPDQPDEAFENHRRVYEFFAQFAPNRDILDVGCGTGYGSALLAERGARRVVGIDYSRQAIRYACTHYRQPNLEYQRMDAQALAFPDASFDLVVSSENLEHLPDPRQNLREIRRVLRPGGLLALGTPNKELFSPGKAGTSNRYHLHEFTYEQLKALVAAFFAPFLLFENQLEPSDPIGRRLKTDRVARGALGIDPRAQSTLPLGDLTIDLTTLHNTHSFMVVARRPF